MTVAEGSRIRVLCVVGPTAVGKSDVADAVAAELGGEVVSCDSMQVYRGMDIGTAKTPAASRRVRLHMVDICDPARAYSVKEFQRDARACVRDIATRGKVPVLCGGTGLYLDAVVDAMEFPPGDVSNDARGRYEAYAAEHGPQALHDLLRRRDPQSADEIHPHNVRRVIRALELADEGKSYAEHHRGLKSRAPYFDAQIWSLTLPRDELYRRIDARVARMREQGLWDEVQRLAAEGLAATQTASQAIGYKELLQARAGLMGVDEAFELIARNTRRYAKRQLSWIRRDGRAHEIDMGTHGIQEAARLICEGWRSS